jgi:rRNA maturation endonuclease Nob1
MKQLAAIQDCGPNVPAVTISSILQMLSNNLIRRVVRLRTSSIALRECRHCGCNLKHDADECPTCGSREIASYNLE